MQYKNTLLDSNEDLVGYLSGVIRQRQNNDSEYQDLVDRKEKLKKEHPNIDEVFDSQNPIALTVEDSKALIELFLIDLDLDSMDNETCYLRGCYDSMSYLERAGFNGDKSGR